MLKIINEHRRVIYSLFAISIAVASNTVIANTCNKENLADLLKIEINKLEEGIEQSIFPDKPTNITFNGYYKNKELKYFLVTTKTVQRRMERKYWILSKNNYLAEYIEIQYAPYPDRTIVGKIGNYFYICGGKVVKIEELKDIRPLKYPEYAINSTMNIYNESVKNTIYRLKNEK